LYEEAGKEKIDVVLGDGGFDSESNHEFIREGIGAVSIIKPRKMKVHRTKYRKLMKRL